MKRTISGDQVAVASGGEPSGGAVPEAARRPLRELTDDRLLDALLERSRDQAGSFEPVLVPKRAGRVAGGLDDMVISLTRTG